MVQDLDLEGKTYQIPKGVTIRQKGGVIKNGALIGNRTKLISKKAIFDKVTIKGTWSVEVISTNLFKDLNYINSLRDVVALASPTVTNHIFIEKGNYIFSLDSKNKRGITIPSNTSIQIDGNISITPNDLDYYEILNAKGENITISGKGCIIGDKFQHTGTKGEWGMGIFIRGKNICVRNLTINDCWGDCIYVGGNSRFVHIDNCLIKNVHGTAPQYAIDMEPNKGGYGFKCLYI